MRLRLLPILALVALLAPAVRAQTAAAADPASLALANQLLALTGTQANMLHGLQNGFKPVLEQMQSRGMPAELVQQIQVAADQFFVDNFKWSAIEPQLAQLYVKDFTQSELQDLVNFYQTPTGKKTIALMPQISQDGSALGLAMIKPRLPDLQQKVVVLVQSYQAAHAPAAAAPAAPSSSLISAPPLAPTASGAPASN